MTGTGCCPIGFVAVSFCCCGESLYSIINSRPFVVLEQGCCGTRRALHHSSDLKRILVEAVLAGSGKLLQPCFDRMVLTALHHRFHFGFVSVGQMLTS